MQKLLLPYEWMRHNNNNDTFMLETLKSCIKMCVFQTQINGRKKKLRFECVVNCTRKSPFPTIKHKHTMLTILSCFRPYNRYACKQCLLSTHSFTWLKCFAESFCKSNNYEYSSLSSSVFFCCCCWHRLPSNRNKMFHIPFVREHGENRV